MIIDNLKKTKSLSLGFVPDHFEDEDYSEKKIKVLDSISYVIDPDKLSSVELTLNGFMDVIDVNNPLESILEIINRCTKEKLAEIYKIGEFDDVTDFLTQVAKKKSLFLQGGVPDTDTAMQHVTRDWISGVIPYYTSVPKDVSLDKYDNSWTVNLDIENIYNLENSKIEVLKDNVHNFLVFEGTPNKIDIDVINETEPQVDNISEEEIVEPQTKKKKNKQYS